MKNLKKIIVPVIIASMMVPQAAAQGSATITLRNNTKSAICITMKYMNGTGHRNDCIRSGDSGSYAINGNYVCMGKQTWRVGYQLGAGADLSLGSNVWRGIPRCSMY